eukprot:TRINITY_DN1196_c0_g1_i1.p1 TRINITY_DN1196_c0_g1~~TRINITY_DN1196_c0_g1_i1.p1  ORF type:complete len:534 (-),score=34.62 TRINITY_DN1196_c0_g1_i1:254-1855(-)
MLEEIFKHLWLHEIASAAAVCRLFDRVASEHRVRWSRIRINSENIRKMSRSILGPDPPLSNHVQEIDIHLSSQGVLLPTFRREIKLVKSLSRLKALRIRSDQDKYLFSTFLDGINSADFPQLEEIQLRAPLPAAAAECDTVGSQKTPLFTFLEKFIVSLRSLELPSLPEQEKSALRLLALGTRLEYLKLDVSPSKLAPQGTQNMDLASALERMTRLGKMDLCFQRTDWTSTMLALGIHPPDKGHRISAVKISLMSRLESNDVWVGPTLPTTLWPFNLRFSFPKSAYSFLDYLNPDLLTVLQLPGPKAEQTDDLLALILSRFGHLVQLKLDWWNLSHTSEATILLLNQCATLQILCLESGSLSSQVWQNMALPNLEQLFVLSVTGVMPQFFHSFDKRLPKLHSLALSQTIVPDIGREVLPCLKRHHNLTRVNLNGTGMEADFVSPFITSVGRRLKSFILCPVGPHLSDLDLDTFGHFCLDLENLALCLDDIVLPQAALTVRNRCKSLQRMEIFTKFRLHQQSVELFKQAGIKLV